MRVAITEPITVALASGSRAAEPTAETLAKDNAFRRAAAEEEMRADVRTFARDTLPTLQTHLDDARRLNDEVADARP